MIKVTCVLTNYDDPKKDDLILHNHWNYSSELVVLEIAGVKYSVKASDLIEAVCNCKNVNRWG